MSNVLRLLATNSEKIMEGSTSLGLRLRRACYWIGWSRSNLCAELLSVECNQPKYNVALIFFRRWIWPSKFGQRWNLKNVGSEEKCAPLSTLNINQASRCIVLCYVECNLGSWHFILSSETQLNSSVSLMLHTSAFIKDLRCDLWPLILNRWMR